MDAPFISVIVMWPPQGTAVSDDLLYLAEAFGQIFTDTIIPFLFVFAIVVLFHELGHYLAARIVGVKVLTFSIGIGPELVGFTDRHGTRWKISLLPLGGYILAGGVDATVSWPKSLTPAAKTPATMTADERAGSFHYRSVISRAVISATGPAANFIVGALIFAGIALYYGKSGVVARVDAVVANSPADSAGFKKADVILKIDGATIDSFADMQRIVAMNAETPLQFDVKRGGAIISLTAIPSLREVKDALGNTHQVGVLGISRQADAAELVARPVGLIEAAKIGINQTSSVLAGTAKWLGSLISGTGSFRDFGGVIGIARISGQAARAGFQYLLNLCALLSVSMGILNLVPIPVLDGGHLMFYAAEAVRRRPLSQRTQAIAFWIGLVIVVLLTIVATYNDIVHLLESTAD